MSAVAITYALPMFRAEHIGWLALESLCNQEGIDFTWELIVVEEKQQCLGLDGVYAYESRLRSVGCERIIYVGLGEWVPLSQKWITAVHTANSDGFLLAGCDDYAHPGRIAETKKIFDAGAEWVQSPLGFFYDINAQAIGVYDHSLNDVHHPCALDKAVRTDLLKRSLPLTATQSRNVDNWVYTQVSDYLSRVPDIHTNRSDTWKRGIFTDGLNNIQSARRSMYGSNVVVPFRNPRSDESQTLNQILPDYICSRLKEARPAAQERVEFVP